MTIIVCANIHCVMVHGECLLTRNECIHVLHNQTAIVLCVWLSAFDLYIIMQTLKAYMESECDDDIDLNAFNEDGDGPIHVIVRRKRKKRADLLLALLVNGCSRVDVNSTTTFSGDTALHLAVLVRISMSNILVMVVSSPVPRPFFSGGSIKRPWNHISRLLGYDLPAGA